MQKLIKSPDVRILMMEEKSLSETLV